MANFVAIVDPDAARRSRYLGEIGALLPPIQGLVTGECASGDFATAWAAGEQAPINCISADDGAAVVWGEAMIDGGPARIDALQLKGLWSTVPDSMPEPLDGYHAAVAYDPLRGLVAGADILGLFPLYEFSAADVVLVGSSPELFRHHPSFNPRLNQPGLVGLLLMNNFIDGQTLWHGVRRLAAGHLLVVRPGEAARELRQYRLPTTDKYFGMRFSKQVDLFGDVVDDAVRRHAPANRSHSLLLSGGMDSRLVAGFLQRQGADVTALTLGVPSDIELRCATAVARALNLRHRVETIEAEAYPRCAERQVTWEHLAAGFNAIHHWMLNEHLRSGAPFVISGLLGDSILGGSHMKWARVPKSRDRFAFDPFFTRLNRWGFASGDLTQLLIDGDCTGLVDAAVHRMREIYEEYSNREFQRVWCFQMYHRIRFHMGGTCWAQSFGAWPVLPVVDRRVLDVAGGLPAETLAKRHAEASMLCRRFPDLGRLPLDRNSFDTTPLRRTFRQRLGGLLRRGQPAREHASEARYYYRIYDFNAPHWSAVRRQAEPYRSRLFQVFDRETLDRLLPRPDVSVRVADGIADSSRMKLLLGLMLWTRDHPI